VSKSLFEMTQQERHLRALQMVYRKERLIDARLTREEVLDWVWTEICNDMGSDEACEWADEMTAEIDDGNHD
tara:strand:+ start:724 stop:939 length:216 start_codon:yes stop_codon:yes gene_type:complete